MLKIQKWGHRFKGYPLAFLDTETTGLGDDAEAFQIAIILYDKDGHHEQDLNIQVYPETDIDAKASEITGVSKADLIDCPTYPEVHHEVVTALSGRVVICYNADFDRRILQQTMRRYEVSEWPMVKGVECLMKAYSEQWGAWSEYHGNHKWIKLEQACSEFGIKLDNAHDALADTRATAKLFYAIMNMEKEPEIKMWFGEQESEE